MMGLYYCNKFSLKKKKRNKRKRKRERERKKKGRERGRKKGRLFLKSMSVCFLGLLNCGQAALQGQWRARSQLCPAKEGFRFRVTSQAHYINKYLLQICVLNQFSTKFRVRVSYLQEFFRPCPATHLYQMS